MGGQRKALILASGEYEHDALARLASPTADADALERVLRDPAIGDFEVHVVPNRDSHVIQMEIEELFADGRPDDVLLLHFSGHGLKNESGDLFFAARNTRPNRLASTAVPADFVQRCMRTSRSRSIVVLLDCCYGGAFREGVAVKASGDVNLLDSFPGRLGGGRGRAVITASSSMEYAFEGDRLADDHSTPSVFTGALVQGLETGDADRDEDGWVSLNELYDYIYDRVRERQPNQTPSRDIEMQGELYLARSKRRRIKAKPVPAELRDAMADTNMYTRLGALGELRTRLDNDNLEVAAGALEAVAEMARTDIQNVARAATAVLDEAALAVSATELRFEPGARNFDTVLLLGPPLARACTVETSHEWIHADLAENRLTVSVDSTRGDAKQGRITLTSPTGSASITVDVGTAPSKRKPRDRRPQANPQSSATDPHRETDTYVPRDSRRTAARPGNRLRQTAGALAILSGALMIVGLFPTYMSTRFDSWHIEHSDELVKLWDRAEGMCFLAIAWLVILAGALTLIPSTRRLIGPGLLVGALPAAIWGLLFLGKTAKDGYARDGQDLEGSAQLLLLLAAVLAAVALARDPDVRLARKAVGDLAGLVILFAVAAAALLFVHRLALYDLALGADATKATLAAIPTTLIFPVCAAFVAPRRLAVCLLTGWIATTAAVALYYLSIVAGFNSHALWIRLLLMLLFGLAIVVGYAGRVAAEKAPEPGGDIERRIAGGLAVVAGAVIFAGLSPAYMTTGYDSWHRAIFPEWSRFSLSDRAEGKYLAVMAVIAIVAGALTLRPTTKRFIGPGVLIGVVSAATYGLVFVFGELADERAGQPHIGFWLVLFAHLALVFAAVLAAGALVGDPEARLARRPSGTLARLTVVFAAAGAVLLLLHRSELYRLGLGMGATAASVAAILATLVLPVCAAVAVPRPLGTALLAGWTAGTAAVVGYNFSIIQTVDNGDWLTVFCLPLLGLAIIAICSGRTTAQPFPGTLAG